MTRPYVWGGVKRININININGSPFHVGQE